MSSYTIPIVYVTRADDFFATPGKYVPASQTDSILLYKLLQKSLTILSICAGDVLPLLPLLCIKRLHAISAAAL